MVLSQPRCRLTWQHTAPPAAPHAADPPAQRRPGGCLCRPHHRPHRLCAHQQRLAGGSAARPAAAPGRRGRTEGGAAAARAAGGAPGSRVLAAAGEGPLPAPKGGRVPCLGRRRAFQVCARRRRCCHCPSPSLVEPLPSTARPLGCSHATTPWLAASSGVSAHAGIPSVDHELALKLVLAVGCALTE